MLKSRCFTIFFILAIFPCIIHGALDFKYHNYKNMEKYLKDINNKYPNMTKLKTIGKSVQGRNLSVIEITAPKESLIGVPNVKLIGNIHGNEAVGREVLLHFIEFLLTDYEKNPQIKWFLDNTKIHILPSLNPDGFEKASEGICAKGGGRENSHQIDLNRNFPDFFKKNSIPIQVESLAVQNWMKEVPFILSASLHGGAMVANYPLENHRENVFELKKPSISADDDVFQYLATVYATTHPFMHKGEGCTIQNGYQDKFPGGITNGAAWYPVVGGMQDYNYIFHGCMEITMEISCCKYPNANELPQEWKNNKMALLNYISQAHLGVKGIVFDVSTNDSIENATLQITGRNITFRTTPHGEFWRILLPGSYQLKVEKEGYRTEFIDFEVKNNTEYPQLTTILVNMYPLNMIPEFIYQDRNVRTVNNDTTSSTSIQSTTLKNIDTLMPDLNDISDLPESPLEDTLEEIEITLPEPILDRSGMDVQRICLSNIIFFVVIQILK